MTSITNIPIGAFSTYGDDSLVAEISGLRIGITNHLHVEDGGKVRSFGLVSTDRDAEGDVHGWHYREVGGSTKLLIIND